jgi:hypothetical protein
VPSAFSMTKGERGLSCWSTGSLRWQRVRQWIDHHLCWARCSCHFHFLSSFRGRAVWLERDPKVIDLFPLSGRCGQIQIFRTYCGFKNLFHRWRICCSLVAFVLTLSCICLISFSSSEAFLSCYVYVGCSGIPRKRHELPMWRKSVPDPKAIRIKRTVRFAGV